jgi:tetratricopeptide (TPR) repeat protein
MRGVVILLAGLLGTTAAHAGAIEDCNQSRDLDRQLRGCTAYIQQALGGAANLATAHLNRANAHAQRGKLALALADYGAAMSLEPKNPLAPYNRGNTYFDIGNYNRAIADYTLAIELDGDFVLAYLNRGLAHERRGDAMAALADYRSALRLDPSVQLAQDGVKRMLSH